MVLQALGIRTLVRVVLVSMSNAPRNAAANRDWGHDTRGCTVLHIDMDAFYASLEIARHPEYAGQPVIIGTGNRSVVSAANYEARTYGINSAMASARAHQLCPNGIFLPVDIAYYRDVSQQIFTQIFSQVTDQIEQVSVDECYMNVAGALLQWHSPTRIGAWLRAQVESQFHVTCSVGIAANKLVAKLASTNAKPNGMLLIPADQHAAFVRLMPLRAIPGIGPAQARRLQTWGITTIDQLRELDINQLTHMTGSSIHAQHLYQAARGIDTREVVPYTPEKSIGSEHTFAHDVRDTATVLAQLHACCDEVAHTLRKRALLARTVTVKLRFPDLRYMTKSLTIEQPTDSAAQLYPVCKQLLIRMLHMDEHADTSRLPTAVRLAGMQASGLCEQETAVLQPTLDDVFEETQDARASTTAQRLRGAEQALDAVRHKFGKHSASFGWTQPVDNANEEQ